MVGRALPQRKRAIAPFGLDFGIRIVEDVLTLPRRNQPRGIGLTYVSTDTSNEPQWHWETLWVGSTSPVQVELCMELICGFWHQSPTTLWLE